MWCTGALAERERPCRLYRRPIRRLNLILPDPIDQMIRDHVGDGPTADFLRTAAIEKITRDKLEPQITELREQVAGLERRLAELERVLDVERPSG